MLLSEFKYYLPKALIAQEPLPKRDESRLLILNRRSRTLKQTTFNNIIRFIHEGDIFVLNDTRVLPARLMANRETGAQLEVLLLKEQNPGIWEILVKPGKRAHLGDNLVFAAGKFCAEILDRTPVGGRLIRFNTPNIKQLIYKYGQMPLPNYIKKKLKAPARYQTLLQPGCILPGAFLINYLLKEPRSYISPFIVD